MALYRVSLFNSDSKIVAHTHVDAHNVSNAIALSGLKVGEGEGIEVRPVTQDELDDATVDAAYMSGF